MDWLSTPQRVGECLWSFPPPSDWPDNDLIAKGADMAPATLIAAYRQGLFPMKLRARDTVPRWWSPNPRGILPLDQLRVTRSMRQSAKKYEVRIDTCFAEVVRGCANPARKHGWIDQDTLEGFTVLHELGWAHSVEVFDREGRLSGGLYGVRINRFFAGESMFHIGRDGSKVALMSLVQLMRDSGMTLLDVQWRTDFLASLGVVEVGRPRYLALLADAVTTGTAA